MPQRLEKTLRFRVELVKQMGEQKIDVVVKYPGMEGAGHPPRRQAVRHCVMTPMGWKEKLDLVLKTLDLLEREIRHSSARRTGFLVAMW